MPLSATVIMLATVAVTVSTHNLAFGVLVGVLVAMVFFVRRISRLVRVDGAAVAEEDGVATRRYQVSGALFFASSNDLVYQFDYAGDPQRVLIDLTGAQVLDSSTVAALDAIELKYAQRGKRAEVVGLNEVSRGWHERLTGRLKAGVQ